MRGGAALALLAFVAVAAGPGPSSTTWGWQSADGNSSLSFWRDGTGPLHVVAAAYASCPAGGPTGIAYLPTTLPEISVGGDGAIAYDGPVTLRSKSNVPVSSITIALHARISGPTASGTFMLAADIGGTTPCHAQSVAIKFTARCHDGPCPRDVTRLPVTVWPGVGIGGSSLGMLGVARLGMTQTQLRALHTSAPLSSQLVACGLGNRGRCGWLLYQYRSGGRGRYLVNPRVTTMSFLGRELKTPAGIVAGSSRQDVVRAYPSVRCTAATGCFLLRGTTARGVLTGFAFAANSLFSVSLFDCVPLHTFCRKAVGP